VGVGIAFAKAGIVFIRHIPGDGTIPVSLEVSYKAGFEFQDSDPGGGMSNENGNSTFIQTGFGQYRLDRRRDINDIGITHSLNLNSLSNDHENNSVIISVF
jgi:hypothetical protein